MNQYLIHSLNDASCTYNNERRIVKLVLPIDVYTPTDHLLTCLQVTVSTGHEELVKLWTLVERVLISKNATLDKECFFAEFAFEFIFSKNHDFQQSVIAKKKERISSQVTWNFKRSQWL